MTGSSDTRLILVRGNSASGKSTLARSIRSARPRGIAILGQDQLRREILHTRKPQATDYGPDRMREWWLDTDPMPGITEHPPGEGMTLMDATNRVLSDCDWPTPTQHVP